MILGWTVGLSPEDNKAIVGRWFTEFWGKTCNLSDDLARLRSPHNLAEFKEDLWAHARETKDGVVAQVKARAAANPLAVAALAAGVAWRLFHRPPIATLLVGLGLVGLLRTSPSQADHAGSEDFFDREEWTARASAFQSRFQA
jgi:hypothetical protein